MTISELITEFERLRAENGDLHVYMEIAEYDYEQLLKTSQVFVRRWNTNPRIIIRDKNDD